MIAPVVKMENILLRLIYFNVMCAKLGFMSSAMKLFDLGLDQETTVSLSVSNATLFARMFIILVNPLWKLLMPINASISALNLRGLLRTPREPPLPLF